MDSGLISTYLTKVGTENFVFPMDVYGFDCGGSGEFCISHECV